MHSCPCNLIRWRKVERLFFLRFYTSSLFFLLHSFVRQSYDLGVPFSERLELLSFCSLFLFSAWARSTARKVTISQALRIPTSRSRIIDEPTIYNARTGFSTSTNAAIISKIWARRGNTRYHSQSSNVD